MTRMFEMLAIGATAGFLTLGLVTAEARDGRAPRRGEATPVVVADTAVPDALAARAEAGQAAAEQIVQSPACARKVKVVYAGYGEGDRAACPPAR